MKKLAITVNGRRYEVEVEVLQEDDAIETQPAFRPPVRSAASAPTASLPQKPRLTIGDQRTLTSPINGVVLEVLVHVGDEVSEKDPLVVLEAMKMKTNISSPQTGHVASIDVKAGDRVETGQVLVTFA